jgi:hypothetical protein
MKRMATDRHAPAEGTVAGSDYRYGNLQTFTFVRNG